MNDDEKLNTLIDAVASSLKLQGIRIETTEGFIALVDMLRGSGVDSSTMKPSDFDEQVAKFAHPSHFTNKQPAKPAVPVIDHAAARREAQFQQGQEQFKLDIKQWEDRCASVSAVGGIMPAKPQPPKKVIESPEESGRRKLALANAASAKKREEK